MHSQVIAWQKHFQTRVPAARLSADRDDILSGIIRGLNREFRLYLTRAAAFNSSNRVLLLDRANNSYFLLSFNRSSGFYTVISYAVRDTYLYSLDIPDTIARHFLSLKLIFLF